MYYTLPPKDLTYEVRSSSMSKSVKQQSAAFFSGTGRFKVLLETIPFPRWQF